MGINWTRAAAVLTHRRGSGFKHQTNHHIKVGERSSNQLGIFSVFMSGACRVEAFQNYHKFSLGRAVAKMLGHLA